jgi:RimJ/RimL family protein N-acetyltransferase
MMAYADEPYGYLAALARDLEDAEEGGFLGWFHLRPSVFEPEILEIGYRLARRYWSRGLATEGSRALLHHAFGALDQERVDACTDPDNRASRRVMEKLGMGLVGDAVHPRGDRPVVRYLIERATVER